jgi:hypothetical protein
MKRTILILMICSVFAVGCEDLAVAPSTPMTTAVERDTWNSPVGPGEVLQSKNYRIFLRSRSNMLSECLPGFMEAANAHYLELTGLSANSGVGRMDLYVLGSRDEWVHLTKHRLGTRSKVYLKLEAGGYMVDGVCVLWDLNRVTATFSVAKHEGLHQFLYHRLKDRIPMWLEEGLCATAEGMTVEQKRVRFTPADNPSRYTSLRRVLNRGYWISLPDLLPMDAGDAIGDHQGKATGYYAQVWSLVLFIRDHADYREGLQQMLNDAAAGTMVDQIGIPSSELPPGQGRAFNRMISVPAFRHYITDDLEAFEKEWLAYAKKLAGLGL